MLKNIKSSYFINTIFSFLNEKQKLKIIKFNKNLQKYFNIAINYYKFFTNKFIIYESNRIGKEYDGLFGTLLYEGEYLNGERNGKGKEYDDLNGKLSYEGEYLNGKRNGKGKGYDILGQLEYEGEYLNGKRNGKGREYYYNGKLKYEGEYLNGEINGKGKEYYKKKLKFEGIYIYIITK